MCSNSLKVTTAITSSKTSGGTAKSFSRKSDAMSQQISANSTLQPRLRIIENLVLIWLDATINESDADCRNSITHLRRIVNSINTFTDADTCIDFLTDIKDEKVSMVVSNAIGQQLVPCIHGLSQLYSIYVFCNDSDKYEVWTKEWAKVKGAFTQIEPICSLLEQDTKQCDQDLIPISIVSPGDYSKRNFNELEPSFMYSQILKEILFEMEYDEDAKQYVIHLWRERYRDNESRLKIIDEFEKDYRLHTPIWWYTRNCFIYPMLNRALRTMDTEILIKMGFFLSDVHRQIEELYSKTHQTTKMIVYRGQGMTNADFEKMRQNRGGLLSFNNFLSTSTDRQVSLTFADSAQVNSDLIGILFRMEIDPSISSTPFASLDNISHFPEEKEILFSLHTVFRIGKMKPIDNRLWEVDLTMTQDNDQELTCLTEHMRSEIGEGIGWYRLSKLLTRIGEFDRAEEVCTTLLDSTPNNDQKNVADLNHQLGFINQEKGDYSAALSFYQKTLEIRQKTPLPYHLHLAATYGCIGQVHSLMRDCSTALSFYQKTLEIQQNSLPSNHPQLAVTYSSIGQEYKLMGDSSTALSFYQKTLEIQQNSLPSNHPQLATTYKNIGEAHKSMGDYSSTLSFYQKTLEIERKSLPPDHPHLATTYSDIGAVHDSIGDYPTALSFFQKALEIQQKTLPPNHPYLATTYHNIGRVRQSMGDYSSTLSFYQKTLEIQEKSLLPDSSHLATTYNDIGGVHDLMGDCSTALSFYQKALEIKQKYLPPNHSSLAATYSNIGVVHQEMGDSSNALSFYQKALEIEQKSLPPDHPHLATTYNNIGGVHQEMRDSSTALTFYQKTLEIKQKYLRPDHPSLATIYNNMAFAFEGLHQFHEAVECAERAVNISRHALGHNHPHTLDAEAHLDRMRREL